ncbi:DNA-directed RNA polymerase II (plasmid) [Paraburkholderia kururiensis]
MFTAPPDFTSSVDCETIWPPWFDTELPATVCAPVDERTPLSFVSVPVLLADSEPPAVVVAPVRFRLPPFAASVRLPFAEVCAPARFTPAPESDALPPAALWPVADSAPDAETVRSPALAIVPSLLMPAPSVPVDARLPALTVVFCWAASVPLFVRSAAVLTETFCCA